MTVHTRQSGGPFTQRSLEDFALTSAGDGGWPGSVIPCVLQAGGQTFICYVDSAGNVEVRSYTIVGGLSSAFTLKASLGADWHNAPALATRTDGRLVAAYCAHLGNSVYVRISTNPHDASAWGSEADIDAQLGGSEYTYPTLLNQGGTLWLFIRNHNGNPNPTWSYSTSGDGGTTWTPLTALFAEPGKDAYMRFIGDGEDRIDCATTDGTVLAGDAADVYHFYIEGGARFGTDGTPIAASLPLDSGDVTLVYDGATHGARYVADIARAGSTIVVTFPVFVTPNEEYRYCRWDGSSWTTRSVAVAGTSAAYAWEEGGIVVHPRDPDRVWLSAVSGGAWQVFDYRTTDAGASWTSVQVTAGSDHSFYVVAVRDPIGDMLAAWLYGTATSYTSYSLAIVGGR